MFDAMTWPVSFLLLLCAVRNLSHFVHQHAQDNSLSEPLLTKKSTGKSQKSELDRASFLSKLTFAWINPLLNLGCSKTLALEDIPSLVSEDEADLAYLKFANAWDSFLREKSSSSTRNLVLQTVVKVYMKENMWIAFCAFIRTIAIVISPLMLYAFVNYSTNENATLSEGFTIVGCLVLSKVVESLSQRHWFFNSRRSGMRMRSALMVAVYKKQLKLSSLGRRRHSAGEIVNYIAVDAYRMGEFPMVATFDMDLRVATIPCHWSSFLGGGSWCSSWFASSRHLWSPECAICKDSSKVSVPIHDRSRWATQSHFWDPEQYENHQVTVLGREI